MVFVQNGSVLLREKYTPYNETPIERTIMDTVRYALGYAVGYIEGLIKGFVIAFKK